MKPERAMETDEPYRILGVAPGADEAEVRAAYRAALRRHPPEGDPQGFKRLRAAYEAVRDPAAAASTALFAGPRIPGRPAPTDAELGVPRVVAPTPEELSRDLRTVAFAGTDFTRTSFPEDLHDPVGSPNRRDGEG